MNIQRFTAATSREAMAKARNAFGDSAVILSSRATDDGFEVMAAAEESLAPVAPSGRPAVRSDQIAPILTRGHGKRPIRPPMFDDEDSSVEADTEALAMSTLSFQDYVRERMLRKRRGEQEAAPVSTKPIQAPEVRVAPPKAAQVPTAQRAQPLVTPTPAPQARQSAQVPAWGHAAQMHTQAAVPMQSMFAVPPPILTQAVAGPRWESPVEGAYAAAAPAQATNVAGELAALKDMMEER
ncbi:MAG: hypothetical protein WEK74_00220, partial [Hydrogenophaga sp.]